MEIIFEKGKISILEATKAELKSFYEFMFEEVVEQKSSEIVNRHIDIMENIDKKEPTEIAGKTKEVKFVPVKPIEQAVMSEVVKKPVKAVVGKEAEKEEEYYTVREAADKFGLDYYTLTSRLQGKNITKITDISRRKTVYRLSDIKPYLNPPRKRCLKEKPTVEQKVVDERYGDKSWRNVANFVEWAKAIRIGISSCGLNEDIVLHDVYRKMTKEYGIVWQQVRSDYRRELRETTRDKLRLTYFLQYEQEENKAGNLTRLFENLVVDACNKRVS